LEVRTLGSCVHGQKTGHLASREGLSRDAGQWGQNTGHPGKYGTVGNPPNNIQTYCVDFSS